MQEEQYKKRPGLSAVQLGRLVVNFLTVLIVLTTIGVGTVFAIVFVNPYWDINPYPPPTIPATLGSPSPTVTPAVTLPVTWTPGPTITPSQTPTVTLTPTITPTSEDATPVVEEMPFALQIGSPARIQNYVRVDDACNWMGIGGQVFNLGGEPIIELTVHFVGELDGLEPFDLFALSGSSTELGPGGYLFEIADHPIASQGAVWIQLDDGSGNPLSEVIYLDTSDSCTENLILVNFRQVR